MNKLFCLRLILIALVNQTVYAVITDDNGGHEPEGTVTASPSEVETSRYYLNSPIAGLESGKAIIVFNPKYRGDRGYYSNARYAKDTVKGLTQKLSFSGEIAPLGDYTYKIDPITGRASLNRYSAPVVSPENTCLINRNRSEQIPAGLYSGFKKSINMVLVNVGSTYEMLKVSPTNAAIVAMKDGPFNLAVSSTITNRKLFGCKE